MPGTHVHYYYRLQRLRQLPARMSVALEHAQKGGYSNTFGLFCRAIAADVAKKEVQRTVLGVVQPGDSIPVPYGWQKAGGGPSSTLRHALINSY